MLKIANENKAVLLTEDKDFGELVYRMKLAAYGIIIIRLAGWKPENKTERISEILKEHFSKMRDSFTTIRSDKITIRKLS